MATQKQQDAPDSTVAASGQRKLLVVVDSTPESRLATRFAARRAHNTGRGLILLIVLQRGEFQHWLGVESLMQEEAQEEAQALLNQLAAEIHEANGFLPETVIREGKTREEVTSLIDEDHDIQVLVLGAASGEEGPGPLVSAIAGQLSGGFHIPITIIPGGLSEEQIDDLA